MAENASAANEAKKPVEKDKGKFQKSLKSEFSKIIWPTKSELTRQTMAVVCVSVVMGAFIALIDLVLKYGIDFVVK